MFLKKIMFFLSFIIFHQQGFCMQENNIRIARDYYTAMAESNIDEVAKYIDEDVVFIAPLAKVIGKQDFLKRVQDFFSYSSELTIRVIFGNENQAMVAFTLDYPQPIGRVETAALLNIENNLIIRIELFYDGRLYENLK